MRKRFLVAGLAALLATIALAAPARANAILVTTTDDELNDDGDCSLREAIKAANSNVPVDDCPQGTTPEVDVITIPAGTYTLTIPGSDDNVNASGDLDISGATTLVGAGSSATLIQAGTIGGPTSNGIDRVFEIMVGFEIPVAFEGMTIANGNTTGDGGGIHRGVFGPVSLTDVHVVSNQAGDEGGGLRVNGAVTLTDSVVRDNIALTSGGGLRVTSAPVTLTRSTVSENDAGTQGGGMFVSSLVALNSTIALNTAMGDGGGVLTPNTSTLTSYTNTTIAGNTADLDGDGVGSGGGILSVHHGGVAASKVITNSVLADNFVGAPGPPTPDDCGGAWTSGGGNVVEAPGTGCTIPPDGNQLGVEQPLHPLGIYGGLVPTIMLDAGPAVDFGVGSACTPEDQRGVPRADGPDFDGDPECDSGSTELQSVIVGDTQVIEGDDGAHTMSFPVHLSSPALDLIELSVSVNDASAVSGSDFQMVSDSVTFGPNDDTAQVFIEVFGDTVDEDDEVFEVVLSGGNTVTFARNSAIGTIQDDDVTRAGRTVAFELRRHLKARGVVSTGGPSVCVTSVPVKIQRKTPNGFRTVSPTTSTSADGSGAYSVVLDDRPGKYRAVVPKKTFNTPGGGTICVKRISGIDAHEH